MFELGEAIVVVTDRELVVVKIVLDEISDFLGKYTFALSPSFQKKLDDFRVTPKFDSLDKQLTFFAIHEGRGEGVWLCVCV